MGDLEAQILNKPQMPIVIPSAHLHKTQYYVHVLLFVRRNTVQVRKNVCKTINHILLAVSLIVAAINILV